MKLEYKLPEILRLERKKRGLNQDDKLFTENEISSQTIRFYEKNKVEPSLFKVIKLAELLDIDMNYLLFGIENQIDENDTAADLKIKIKTLTQKISFTEKMLKDKETEVKNLKDYLKFVNDQEKQ